MQREALVISEPNRQVRIARLSAADAEELYVIRTALETVAVRITVPPLRSRDLAELEGYLAQMDHYRKAGDEAGFRAPHRAFQPTGAPEAGSVVRHDRLGGLLHEYMRDAA